MSQNVHSEASTADAAMAAFERETSRHGRWTMSVGLVLSLLGPIILVIFTDFQITPAMVGFAFLAVASVYAVFWVVEPLTYFPILGSAAMYQAFMIGNISNKLVPSAIVAQDSINAKPGTRRGDIAAVMAICGAATVHLLSLLVFVGVLGTWLVSLIPADVIEVARLYILPAILGGVFIQTMAAMGQVRPAIVALVVGLTLQFIVLPLVPGISSFITAVSVVLTIIVSWLVRKKSGVAPNSSD